MSDVSLNSALHHRASIVVFDITFPSWLWQVMVLGESLLSEVLDSIVVSVGQKVEELFGRGVILQLVHEA